MKKQSDYKMKERGDVGVKGRTNERDTGLRNEANKPVIKRDGCTECGKVQLRLMERKKKKSSMMEHIMHSQHDIFFAAAGCKPLTALLFFGVSHYKKHKLF